MFPELPGHSTVDGKVKRVRKANQSIEDQNNIFCNIVIHEAESETVRNMNNMQERELVEPVGEGVKGSDDHERNLSGKEDSNDHDEHQGCAPGISLLTALVDQAATSKGYCLASVFRADQRKSFSCPTVPSTATATVPAPLPPAGEPAPPLVSPAQGRAEEDVEADKRDAGEEVDKENTEPKIPDE